ncbi:MAG TPA: neutral zinc metallopeptidase, partial [Pyrinomonadaceae bacterium]|nr:neutral zinc metallopeptidase [Pyrinomonadaceae bacterium]
MRWGDQRQSDNIEDRRGMGGRGIAVGGGGLGVIILAIIIYLCGGDPSQLLQNGPTGTEVQVPGTASNRSAKSPDENRQFAGAVM